MLLENCKQRIKNMDILIIVKILTIYLALTYPLDFLHRTNNIIMICGIILLSIYIFNNYREYKKTMFYIMFVFILYFVFVSILRHDSYSNIKEVGNMYLLVFGLANYGKGYNINFSKIVFQIFILISFVIAIIDIYMYLINYTKDITIQGSIQHLGIFEGRLWGLMNANITAFICLSSIVVSILFLYKNKKKNIFFILNMIIQSIVCVLTQSRSILGVYTILIIYWSIFVFNIDNKSINKYKKIFLKISIIIGIILAVITLFFSITYKREKIKQDVYKEKINKFNNFSQGRTHIWKESFDVIKKHPIVGSGLRPVREGASNYYDGKWALIVSLAGVHNIYIMLALVLGLIGLSIFVVFIIYIFLKFVVVIFNFRNIRIDKSTKIIMVFLLSLFLEEMLESRMLFTNNYYTVIFWMMMGYTFYKIDEKDNID